MTKAREARGGLVDLHAHTLASDGSDRPDELVAAAAVAGVEVLAVTDHDTVAGVAGARAAGERLGVEVLTGSELTATVGDRVVHLLLYGNRLLEPELADAVQVARHARDERNRAIGERLEGLCGVGYHDAVRVAGESALSRAHFARALVAHRVVADVAEAFDRFLSSGRPAYVPAPGVSVTDAVAVAGKAGGVAVLAHPGRLATAERDRVLGQALDAGIDGIEVWHPQHDPDLRRSLERLADRHGLLATGGSDYHGHHKPDVHLGTGTNANLTVPPDRLDASAAASPPGEPAGSGHEALTP